MDTRLVGLVSVGVLIAWTAQAPAAQIPCDPGFQRECMTNFTCQTEFGSTFCSGEPKQDGTECTSGTPSECSSGPFACKNGACKPTVMAPDHTACTHDITGGCMLNAECLQGFCVGSVPAQDGTTCSFADSKCPGSCKAGSCEQNPCTQPSDPCMQSICNPADGKCLETPKCAGTFFGCETCSAGVCQPANIGQPCTNSQGDFNSCTTDDRCVNEHGLGICMGVPISEIPCGGDCNHKHQVTVDNLITMSAIMLGDEPVDDCPAGDRNNDRVITIDEEVKAEINAISGCP
jgi:hypothetical protein